MMFIMGLSIDIEGMMKTSAKGAAATTLVGAGLVFILSTSATLIVDIALGQDLGYSLAQACLVGVALTSTSTVIGFKFLTDMGDTFSNVFKTLVSIEVTDGIFSIVLLTILLSVVHVFTSITPDSDNRRDEPAGEHRAADVRTDITHTGLHGLRDQVRRRSD